MMKVAIQFFSVKEAMGKDALGTMRKVADMGYKNWETCELFWSDIPYNYGLAGLPPKEAKTFLQDNGVTVVGTHLSPRIYEDAAELDRFLEYQAEIGCWSPGLAIDFWKDEDELKEKCDFYNHLGEKCKALGLVFHYHNHFHEFQKFGDKTVMDLIAEYTDPELVKIEIDTFWAARGGADPAAVIRQYGERVIMLHQKDFNDVVGRLNLFDGIFDKNARFVMDDYGKLDPRAYKEVGTGTLPIQDYIDAGNEAGTKYITLEQDYTQLGEIESIRLSLENFKKFSGLDWS